MKQDTSLNQMNQVYRANVSMLTDLYQLTMAYAAWKAGTVEGPNVKIGVFDLYFRNHPFAGGYAINCGLNSALEIIESFRFEKDDCEYLAGLKGADGKPLFEPGFTEFLGRMKLSVEVDAVEEGRVVFANEPLLRIQGPVWQCQLLETPLLNVINFETLVATKAARVKFAAGDDEVLEFGLRRAQGVDGGLSSARAAYVGGADATSNVMAGKIFGIPLRGTHAHSWVMSYESELESFMKFAEAMPNNSVFLVDTYDTIDGIKNAIEAGLWLKSKGHEMLGVRLDSGDFAYLSIEARRMLDAAGFSKAKIVASNDLDENLIQSLKQQGARVDVWGVGTKLVTAYDQPALGGVCKLTAMRDGSSEWVYRIKLSEQIGKITTPGIHQIRRFTSEGRFVGDMIYDIRIEPTGAQSIIDPADPTRRKTFSNASQYEDLLKPVVRDGKIVITKPTLEEIRERRKKDLSMLHPTNLRFLNPHRYAVGLEEVLHQRKSEMILKLRAQSGKGQ